MKKKILVMLLMLTYIFTSVCTPFVASANSLEVVISSSKVNIDRNMKVQISGKVSTTKVQEITVRVMDPIGNIDYANSTYSNSKGEFIIAYTMRTNLVGKYTVTLGGVGIKKPETCYFEFGKNPRLYSLTPSSGTLEPQFSEEKENYTMKVDARTSQLLWTATAIEKVESIKINDVVVKSGEQSRAFPLKEGENTFKLEVKALSGVTKKYTVKVSKYKQIPADVTATASVNKSDMVSIIGKISSGSGQQISITVFDPKENISYVNHTLSYNGGEFAFTYINQKQVEGEYKVIIGGDGVAKPYKTSFVYGIDLRLKELSISSGVIEGGFNPAVSEYRALVDKKLKQVYLNLKTYDERVNILVNNQPYSVNNPIALNSGNNEVTIKITGVNGAASKTYKLNVNSLDVETIAKNIEAKVNEAQLVTISGNISPVYGQEVSVVVKDPNQIMDYVNSVKVPEGSNGAFSFSYVLTNKKKGEYKVSIGAVGMNSTVDTSFIYGDGNADLEGFLVDGGTSYAPEFKPEQKSFFVDVSEDTKNITIEPIRKFKGQVVKINGTIVENSITVPVANGRNSIYMDVTSKDGEYERRHIISVYRSLPISSNADLGGLNLVGAMINETFEGSNMNYTSEVGYSVDNVLVTPIAANAYATITVNGNKLVNGSEVVYLKVGSNFVVIKVTAENGETKTYTIVITRGAAPILSNNTNLSGLTMDGAVLNEAFVAGKLNYNANVANTVSSITVRPVVADAKATVKVNGKTLTNGGVVVNLVVGDNAIPIEVTAENGTTKTYIVKVTRAMLSYTIGGEEHYYVFVQYKIGDNKSWEAAKVSAEAMSYLGKKGYLATITSVEENNLVKSKLMGQGWLGGTDATSYTGDVNGKWYWATGPEAGRKFATQNTSGSGISSTEVGMYQNFISGVEPNDRGNGYSYVPGSENCLHINLDGSWNDYANNNMSIQGYVVEFGASTNILSDKSDLSSLSIDGAVLNESFACGTLNYTVNVANTVASIIVKPVVADTKATVKVDGRALVNGGVTVNLAVGDNTIPIEVTAENGTTKTYTIKVNRAVPVLSNNSNLSSLTIDGAVLNEAFAAGTLNYTASVTNTVASIIVKPVVADTKATVKVDGKALVNGGVTVNLVVGDNTISVEVTAEDGTIKTYSIKVTRTMLSFTVGTKEHYYVFVQYKAGDNKTWSAAKAYAEAMTYQGKKGYLATITSAQENNFVKATLKGQGWLGGTDDTGYTGDVNGKWYWATGPEAGKKFATQNSSGSGISSTEVGMYQNFVSGVEPNDRGNGYSYVPGSENCLHINPDGSWNDYANNNISIQGYVVEFGD